MQVSRCFGKNEGTRFCAMILHLCLLNPFPDQILTTTFIMINYWAQKIHSCGGGSSKRHWQLLGRLLWSGFPSPWYVYQLRSPGVFRSNFFWLLPVVTFRKRGLWIPRADFCLLWKMDGNAAFIQDYYQKPLQFLVIYWENTYHAAAIKLGDLKQTKDGVLKFWVSECNSVFVMILGASFNFPVSLVW